MEDYTYEGFEELERLGFNADYIEIDHKAKIVKPSWTAESLLLQGFAPKGTRMRFLGKNGYPRELEQALSVFSTEKVYVVLSCKVGRSSSDYTFEDQDGAWNTVMFEKAI